MNVALFVNMRCRSNVAVGRQQAPLRCCGGVGCTVEFDERQTCCGQPAFNTGYRAEAPQTAERFIEMCEASAAEAIVSPSGFMHAMVHHYESLFLQ